MGHRLAQWLGTRHRGVLIKPLLHGLGHGIDNAWVAVEIGKALAQINGLALGGKCRHNRENSGANIGELGA